MRSRMGNVGGGNPPPTIKNSTPRALGGGASTYCFCVFFKNLKWVYWGKDPPLVLPLVLQLCDALNVLR